MNDGCGWGVPMRSVWQSAGVWAPMRASGCGEEGHVCLRLSIWRMGVTPQLNTGRLTAQRTTVIAAAGALTSGLERQL